MAAVDAAYAASLGGFQRAIQAIDGNWTMAMTDGWIESDMIIRNATAARPPAGSQVHQVLVFSVASLTTRCAHYLTAMDRDAATAATLEAVIDAGDAFLRQLNAAHPNNGAVAAP